MNFKDYFKFFKKYVPCEIYNGNYWYSYNDIFAICKCNDTAGIKRLNTLSINDKSTLYNIFGDNHFRDDIIPGYMFYTDTLISEIVAYRMTSQSNRAFAKALLYWISYNTMSSFIFKDVSEYKLNILNNMYNIRTIYANKSIYFNLLDVTNLCRTSYKGIAYRIKQKENDLIEFVHNINSIQRVYSDATPTMRFVQTKRRIDPYNYMNRLQPYESNIPLDELGQTIMNFPNIIIIQNNIFYISLPLLYRYLSSSKDNNQLQLLEWMYNYQIPGTKEIMMG